MLVRLYFKGFFSYPQLSIPPNVKKVIEIFYTIVSKPDNLIVLYYIISAVFNPTNHCSYSTAELKTQ